MLISPESLSYHNDPERALTGAEFDIMAIISNISKSQKLPFHRHCVSLTVRICPIAGFKGNCMGIDQFANLGRVFNSNGLYTIGAIRIINKQMITTC